MKRPKLTLTPASITRTRSAKSVKRYASSEYKVIFETVLIGSIILVAILAMLLLISYLILNNTYVFARIAICGGAIVYLALAHHTWTKQHYLTASRMLLWFYYCIALFVMAGWGIDTTFAQLMLAITIVLSGIMLGARSVFVTAVTSIVGMIIVQIAVNVGNSPWFTHVTTRTNFGDVAGFSILLGVLALITGLFDKRTQELHIEEQSLNETLTKEKGTLEKRVRRDSRQIERLQLEQTEQLYKFAELGQLSTLLLHDLSNHLAVLNIDLADLKHQNRGSAAHIEESIGYIEDTVRQASRHMQGKEETKEFDVLACIEASTNLPHYYDLKESIIINAPSDPVLLYGDPLRLSHILFILIRNALEAYPDDILPRDRTVTIQLVATAEIITISVTDHGRGIPPEVREQLFSPLASTKKGGLGIGLFIAKEITQSYFGGTLQLDDATSHTEFILTMPRRTTDEA